jgi:hypothetical protein
MRAEEKHGSGVIVSASRAQSGASGDLGHP